MKLNKDIKIEVHSPEHSAAIQRRLFELGVEWLSGRKGTLHLDSPYLYVESGVMKKDIDRELFIKDKATKATLDDLYNPLFLTNDSCNGKTVEIDGKRYKLVLEE